MKTPAPADLQRWTEEVARDPSSLAFLPLARAYRRMGRREAALQLCMRGLEHYPQHAEAHALLALLHLERGDRERAADEWSVVLRLDANNFEALRGLGFSYLEQDQLSRARQMLERAALLRPGDAAVQEALRLLGTRQQAAAWFQGEEGAGLGGWAFADTPATSSFAGHIRHAAPAAPAEASATVAAGVAEPEPEPVPAYADPGALFDTVIRSGPLQGVLLLDEQGLVLAGRVQEAGRGDALGALLGGVTAEAGRVVRHLGLERWTGLLLETEGALLHVGPVGAATLVVVARRSAPTGWVLRAATQAAEIATRFAEAQA
jgi:tetratricopeptide (TPR) repeat protein